MKFLHFLWVICFGLAISGCQAGLSGQEEPISPPPTITATVVPTLTPLATRTLTPIPKPTATRTPAITLPPTSGQLLDAGNIQAAQVSILKLPGFASAIFWPGDSRLFMRVENTLQEVRLEPLGLGARVPLETEGILSIAPDASNMLVQRGDGGLFIRNRLDGSDTPVKFAAAYFGIYSQDGKTIALGAVDKFEVTLLDAATRAVIKTLSGFETAAPVYGAVPGPDGKSLAWYARATIQLQDVASGTMQAGLRYQEFITGLTFSPDGQWLLVSVGGGLLQAVNIDLPGGVNAVDLALLPDTRVVSPVFSPDGKLAAAGMGSEVGVWETENWTQAAVLKQDETFIRLVEFSPDGKILVTLDEADLLSAWRVP